MSFGLAVIPDKCLELICKSCYRLWSPYGFRILRFGQNGTCEPQHLGHALFRGSAEDSSFHGLLFCVIRSRSGRNRPAELQTAADRFQLNCSCYNWIAICRPIVGPIRQRNKYFPSGHKHRSEPFGTAGCSRSLNRFS